MLRKKVGQKSYMLTGKSVHFNGTQIRVDVFTKPILNNKLHGAQFISKS